MLNPMFFRGLKSFGADMQHNYGLMNAPRMLGNENFAWSWGTHFNPSPLGYELYLTNYFRLSGKFYTLSLKTGRPYKNNAISIQIPYLLEKGKFSMGIAVDAWDQDIFDKGGSLVLNAQYQPPKGFGFPATDSSVQIPPSSLGSERLPDSSLGLHLWHGSLFGKEDLPALLE